MVSIKRILTYALASALIAGLGLGTWHYWRTRHLPANIVLIIIDLLRADKVGAYGAQPDISPELDQLAKRGVLCKEAFAVSSWTRPSMGAMLTSRYPRSLGIEQEQWDILPDDVITVAEILKAHGYVTIGVTANPNINSIFNFHQGFDRYRDSKSLFNWMYAENSPDKKPYQQERAETLLPGALAQAQQAPPEQPLFMMINVMDVHQYYSNPRPTIDPDLQSRPFPNYLQSVRYTSTMVKNFIDAFVKLPGRANTLFIITSDHGEGLGDHPAVLYAGGHRFVLYESNLRVPLILFNPADPLLEAHPIAQRVTLLDLAPTIVEYAGAAPLSSFEGQSILRHLKTDRSEAEPPVLVFSETKWGGVNKVGVYGAEWKYFENRDDWPGTDPQELQHFGYFENGKATNQLAAHPEAAALLAQALIAWEQMHPARARTQPMVNPTPADIEKLRSLGYVK